MTSSTEPTPMVLMLCLLLTGASPSHCSRIAEKSRSAAAGQSIQLFTLIEISERQEVRNKTTEQLIAQLLSLVGQQFPVLNFPLPHSRFVCPMPTTPSPLICHLPGVKRPCVHQVVVDVFTPYLANLLTAICWFLRAWVDFLYGGWLEDAVQASERARVAKIHR